LICTDDFLPLDTLNEFINGIQNQYIIQQVKQNLVKIYNFFYSNDTPTITDYNNIDTSIIKWNLICGNRPMLTNNINYNNLSNTIQPNSTVMQKPIIKDILTKKIMRQVKNTYIELISENDKRAESDPSYYDNNPINPSIMLQAIKTYVSNSNVEKEITSYINQYQPNGIVFDTWIHPE
jgi:hypothetical protein